MSRLVQIVREIGRGLEAYEFAYNELDTIERAFKYRQDVKDIVSFECDKLVDAQFRYAGLMTQGYILGSAISGVYSPAEAIDGIIFVEGLKALAHFWTQTKIPRLVLRLKELKAPANTATA